MKQIRRDAWWNKSKLRDYQKIKDSKIENEGNDPKKETSQFNKSKKNSLKKREVASQFPRRADLMMNFMEEHIFKK